MFARPIDIIANQLGNRARKEFGLPLRRAVMKAIMTQDTEYFDFNQSAQLQVALLGCLFVPLPLLSLSSPLLSSPLLFFALHHDTVTKLKQTLMKSS